MARLIAYAWFALVMGCTAILPDFQPVLRLRGWLVKRCFRSCGRNFQIAGAVRINFTTRMAIGNDVYIAPGCWINANGGVTIEDEVLLGPYTVLATSDHVLVDGSYRFAPPNSAPICIGRGSWTCAHVVVARGIAIGRGVLVAAGSVVTKDVPDGCMVGGVPARLIERSAHRDTARDQQPIGNDPGGVSQPSMASPRRGTA